VSESRQKDQIQRRLHLKIRMSAAVCFLSIFAVTVAYGQISKMMGRVDVEHKFMVKEKEMPAGTYEFVRTAEQYRLLIRNRATGAATYVNVVERLARTDSSDGKGRVVFNSVGDEKILSEFWPSNNEDGYLLQVTKKEHKHEVLKAE